MHCSRSGLSSLVGAEISTVSTAQRSQLAIFLDLGYGSFRGDNFVGELLLVVIMLVSFQEGMPAIPTRREEFFSSGLVKNTAAVYL